MLKKFPMKQEKIYIYGKHAVEEAVRNAPQVIQKVFLSARNDKELIRILEKAKIPIGDLNGNDATGGLDRGAKHQGVIGRLSLDRLVKPYSEFIKTLKPNPNTCLVLLGELQDPQNVGAIIRTAAAFGISGILIPEHNQAPITGAVVKVSAGMAFRVPLVSIGNVNSTLRDLKERGFWSYGMAGESKQSITTEVFESPTVFVLGNEGAGLRTETRKMCDVLLSIPMHKQCESLNVAASAAVALYAWSQRHPNALHVNKA